MYEFQGLNAAIPEGCSFGYHAGGWGKPPVDETGKPLYGDVFGVTGQDGGVAQVEQDIDKMYLFGTLDEGNKMRMAFAVFVCNF